MSVAFSYTASYYLAMAIFSTTFLAEIKTALEQMLEKAQKQLAELKEGGSAFPNYGEGEDESAEEVATYDTNLQLIDSLQTDIRDAKDALDRLEKGTYGLCRYCNKPIDEQRLRARSASSSCVACKKALTQEV